jgi:uncharacterized protein YqiB (DUF1249 family)
LGVATVVLTIITYLPNYTFTIDINMNLPAYSNLQYPSNAIYVYQEAFMFSTPEVATMLLKLPVLTKL